MPHPPIDVQSTETAVLERRDSNYVSDASTTQEVQHQNPCRASSGSSVIEEILCAACGRTNTRDRAFCSTCGRSLWEACPKCAQQCIVGDTFCGSCGGNLPEMIREQEAAYEARIDEAFGLGRAHEYEKAISRLRSIARVTDARYEQVAHRAAELIDKLSAQYENRQAQAATAYRRARESITQYDYKTALRLLASIPPSLRDEQSDALLQKARSARDEVRSLHDEIRKAAKENRLLDLAMRIDRLLALKPGHQQAARIARQLRSRLYKAAKRKIAECRYGDAVGLLDQVPSSERNSEVEDLAAYACELNWLKTDLELAAVADKTLAAIAERLRKHQPDDKEAESLKQRIERRARKNPSDPRFAAPNWSIPREPHLGFPVDWLGVPQRIRCAAEILETLRKTPGCHFVACGLALQGVQRAAIHINLVPLDKGRVLDKFSFRRKKNASAAWGLDVGVSSVKAVRLHYDKASQQMVVDVVDLIEHGKNLSHTDEEIEKRTILKDTLARFLERNAIRGERICMSVSGHQVLGRIIDLPQVEDKKVDQLVRIEARHRVPVPLAELTLGYQILETDENERAGHPQMRVALEAVKSYHADQLLKIAGEAGLNVDVLQSDCMALHNFATYEFFGKADNTQQEGQATEEKDAEAVAMLDVGAHGSNLVISSPTLVWFRSLRVGGEAFTSDLLKPFRLTKDQAEQLKREPTRARYISRIYDAIGATLSSLGEDVQRSVQAYSRLYPDVIIRQMFGIGGGFALHGLLRRLRYGR